MRLAGLSRGQQRHLPGGIATRYFVCNIFQVFQYVTENNKTQPKASAICLLRLSSKILETPVVRSHGCHGPKPMTREFLPPRPFDK